MIGKYNITLLKIIYKKLIAIFINSLELSSEDEDQCN
jgi:hypothetical protein